MRGAQSSAAEVAQESFDPEAALAGQFDPRANVSGQINETQRENSAVREY